MIRSRALFAATFLIALSCRPADGAEPLKLHPDNPHYFLFRGRPTVLITSAEHYGAVVNLDFDYIPYLNELQARGFNLTRLFTGVYVEHPAAFNIRNNTLAPLPGRFISPWARSTIPGYAGGGNKFDLARWDEEYFRRLKDFIAQAGRRGIVAEVVLFCPYYGEEQWNLSPLKANNNVNSIGDVPRAEVLTLRHVDLIDAQDRFVRKMISELNAYDNLYYEVCNEPYATNVPNDWQDHVIAQIIDSEASLPSRHLVSQNVANGTARVLNPNKAVSIFNFHYAAPPDAVFDNFHLGRVIGDNETGFRGTEGTPYRIEGWNFIIAGGALFNNLDYSFTAAHENGTFLLPSTQPGGGGGDLRRQIEILKNFINGFEFVKMRPDNTVIKAFRPGVASARALVEPGEAYAIYLGPKPLRNADFSVRWTGQIRPRFSETYTFHTISNDGIRLWIDGQLIVDNWTDHAATEDKGQIKLKGNQRYVLRLEYYQSGGGSVAKLFWSSPTQRREAVRPAGIHDRGSRSGFKGEYFRDKKLTTLELVRRDAAVNFDWTASSPFDNTATQISSQTKVELTVELPSGLYKAEWLNPRTGKVDKTERLNSTGATVVLTSPRYSQDIALSIKRVRSSRN